MEVSWDFIGRIAEVYLCQLIADTGLGACRAGFWSSEGSRNFLTCFTVGSGFGVLMRFIEILPHETWSFQSTGHYWPTCLFGSGFRFANGSISWTRSLSHLCGISRLLTDLLGIFRWATNINHLGEISMKVAVLSSLLQRCRESTCSLHGTGGVGWELGSGWCWEDQQISQVLSVEVTL